MNIFNVLTAMPVHGIAFFVILGAVLVNLYIIAWGYRENTGATHRVFSLFDTLLLLAVAYLGHYAESPFVAVAAVAGLGYWRTHQPSETPLPVQLTAIVMAGIASFSMGGAVLFALTVAFFYYRLIPKEKPTTETPLPPENEAPGGTETAVLP